MRLPSRCDLAWPPSASLCVVLSAAMSSEEEGRVGQAVRSDSGGRVSVVIRRGVYLESSRNCLLSEREALIHMMVVRTRMPASAGVDAASEPKPKMRNCWMSEPPLLPSGLPITSTAALPFVFCSASSGMYAISLHGSKSEYFEAFERMFCMAPTMTASMSGVVPREAIIGSSASLKRMSEKKMEPVTRMEIGVTSAATPQPNFSKMVRPRSIMPRVTAPVAEENWPMKAE